MKRLLTPAIIIVSALLGVAAAWQAPGIDRYSRDWLMRARGTLPAPADIVIIAIDEKSITRFGRFPWPRSVMAKAVDAIAAARPKAVALDVVYADPGIPADDNALSEAIQRAGNVAVAAQLIESEAQAQWLAPLPHIRDSAAAVGHVNVHTEAEGIAREVPMRVSDDHGNVMRALAVEAIRIAERLPEPALIDQPGAAALGSRVIPVTVVPPAAVIEASSPSRTSPLILRGARMPIEYIGPAGSFITYSLVDVVEGHVSPARLRDTYALVGATAASLGDRLSTPFTHYNDITGKQHGAPVPGVEVLANSLNTILRQRFYREVSDWIAFLWAAAIAALTLALLAAAQGGPESLKQVGALSLAAGAVLFGSWIAYTEWLVWPPVTSQAVSFASAGVLGLLRRSVATRTELDAAIGNMAGSDRLLAAPASHDSAAEAIGRLLGATGVVIERATRGRRFEPVASWGQLGPPDTANAHELEGGRLLVTGGASPENSEARAVLALAQAGLRGVEAASVPRWPAGLVERARMLRSLNDDLMERSRFVDLAMRSVGDGLVVAGPDARISFANASAAAILQAAPEALTGQNLLERIHALDNHFDTREALRSLLADRTGVEREIATVRMPRPQRYILRIAPVAALPHGPVTGLIATFADISKQAELQQTKNDVISLVSHEMRTPLTAIQGMTELLASYEMPEERRREINLAINDEAKRLTRMITQYLDITRLESGATVLRLAPTRLEHVIDRVVLMLGPVAAARDMRLEKDIAPGLPGIVADADLLFRALENLVANAIKYSSPRTAVTIFARATAADAVVEVRDRGRGIPPEHVPRIFDKFYRVPHIEDANVPGTGLGLSLVREIVELHGGSTYVETEIDKGSVFTLSLPLAGRMSNFVKS